MNTKNDFDTGSIIEKRNPSAEIQILAAYCNNFKKLLEEKRANKGGIRQ